ncbi:MAG TPA: hypothetical protein VM344_06885 [Vitreimonas sp.]|nr:hypothetical protein [Vitreimonas sp.]
MTASEFAFLSLGLFLGVLGGAALIEIIRSRPPAPREVRLTVTPDIVPRRRSATLAEDAFVLAGPEPAVAGPADRRRAERRAAPLPSTRTPVRSAFRAPMGGRPAFAAAGSGGGAVAVPIVHGIDWTLQAALRPVAATAAEHVVSEQRSTATATIDGPRPVAAEEGGADAPGAADPPGAAEKPAGRDEACAEVRRVADERCAVADRAQGQARIAADALRDAQRAYDEHHRRADEAATAADPRAVRVAKEVAQHAFHDARSQASTPEALEAAARDWLAEINRINLQARESAAATVRERDAAHALVMTIERRTVEADGARIAAESAVAACMEARQAVADCQESAAAGETGAGWPAAPSTDPGSRSGPWEDESELRAALGADGRGEPAILRLLRGDRATLGTLVARLGGDDPAERRHWQLTLSAMVDGIVARAIEAGTLTFPVDHPFWGGFALQQNREIVRALASLGYRFNGLGGWADERIPGQRDLSLAVGYAGLDPMRVRPWPSEAEMVALFADVAVAADEYLAEAAGGLTLGELVGVLGRRADGLADLWNAWGRVRPLLLEGS